MEIHEIYFINYTQKDIETNEKIQLESLFELLQSKSKSQVRFYSVHDMELITKIGEKMA